MRLWIGGAVLLFTAGCYTNDAGVKFYTVSGDVTYQGKPVVEAMIVFHPVDGDSAMNQRPMAVTDPSGHFELTTIRTSDGAPAGDYFVTVELRQLRDDGGEMIRDGKNLLPKIYQNPKTSGLRFLVMPGENKVPTIQLK